MPVPGEVVQCLYSPGMSTPHPADNARDAERVNLAVQRQLSGESLAAQARHRAGWGLFLAGLVSSFVPLFGEDSVRLLGTAAKLPLFFLLVVAVVLSVRAVVLGGEATRLGQSHPGQAPAYIAIMVAVLAFVALAVIGAQSAGMG